MPFRKGDVRYLLSGAFYKMAWVETGNPAAPPVVCVHGLTRNGRDFDPLSEALSSDFRVISPDLPGRGASDWLPDATLYQPLSYVQALSHLLAVIGRPVMWVGTSLGGICGMGIAAAPGQPITRLILNDIGGFIPAAALARIRAYIDQHPDFLDLRSLERHLRLIHAPFGALTDAQWEHLARNSFRTRSDGRLVLHYDPAIALPIIGAEPADQDLWAMWQRITIPRLVIRGETSDLLDAATFARMQESGARGLIVPGAGHAPALMDAATIAVIRAFLLRP
jgi:pimeloyl-ACP methyl ester carboxylesterase